MSYRKVEAALESHLQAFGHDNLVFAAARYKPQKGVGYLVANFLPGGTRRVLLGPTEPEERRGFFQIHIHETGHSAALAVLDGLADHFSSGLHLEFESQAVVLGALEAGPDRGTLVHTHIPVSIGWRSYF